LHIPTNSKGNIFSDTGSQENQRESNRNACFWETATKAKFKNM